MTSIATMPIIANRTAAIALSLLTSVALSVAHVVAASAADPAILTGAVTAPGGEAMGGVTVSAKAVGSTITTSVFTDDSGTYYFPTLPPGQYRVWAQALGFETAKGETELKTGGRQDFALAKIEDTEKLIRQLPGDLILAGLPDETADDMRMKRIVHNNCTSCHTPSYILQHRFAEWRRLQDHEPAAAVRRGRARRVQGIRRPAQSRPGPAVGDTAQ
jgi:hypothetical protein